MGKKNKGLTTICPECEFRTSLGVANATLIMFEKQAYLSFVHVVCPRPQCGHEWNTFFDDDPQATRDCVTFALRQGWPKEVHQTAGDWVIKQYEKEIGYELAHTYELTPRHEELIEALRFTLENTPDEHLMDIFSSPPPKSDLPRSWC